MYRFMSCTCSVPWRHSNAQFAVYWSNRFSKCLLYPASVLRRGTWNCVTYWNELFQDHLHFMALDFTPIPINKPHYLNRGRNWVLHWVWASIWNLFSELFQSNVKLCCFDRHHWHHSDFCNIFSLYLNHLMWRSVTKPIMALFPMIWWNPTSSF